MKRRQFIAWLGGAAVAWPFASRAQQPAMPVVGFLRSSSLTDSLHLISALGQGLKEAGFVEGQNVAIESRSAEDHPDRLPALISDLIRRQAAVIVGDTPSGFAAKSAATSIPFVVASGSDPVRDGVVASLNRPGGNITGVVFFNSVLGSKRLELLRQLVPKASVIAMLANPSNPSTAAELRDVEAALRGIGQHLLALDVSSDRDIEPAIAMAVQRGASALLVGSGGFLNSSRKRVVALAAGHALPAAYSQREAVLDGGLMSYGTSITDAYRQAGIYAGRILKGEKPADLPLLQATRFEFVLNLKTAKTLGLDVPDRLLALADEVIE
jgi:putative ABC transport system substrate-binding protein